MQAASLLMLMTSFPLMLLPINQAYSPTLQMQSRNRIVLHQIVFALICLLEISDSWMVLPWHSVWNLWAISRGLGQGENTSGVCLRPIPSPPLPQTKISQAVNLSQGEFMASRFA